MPANILNALCGDVTTPRHRVLRFRLCRTAIEEVGGDEVTMLKQIETDIWHTVPCWGIVAFNSKIATNCKIDISDEITLIFRGSKEEDMSNAEAIAEENSHANHLGFDETWVPDYMSSLPRNHQLVDSAGQAPPPLQPVPIVGTAVSNFWPNVKWSHFEAAPLLLNPDPTVALVGVVVVLTRDRDYTSPGFDEEDDTFAILLELQRRGAAAVLISHFTHSKPRKAAEPLWASKHGCDAYAAAVVDSPDDDDYPNLRLTMPVYSIDTISALWLQKAMTHISVRDRQFRVDIKHKAHSPQNNGNNGCDGNALEEGMPLGAAVHGGVRHGFWKRVWTGAGSAAHLVFTCTTSQAELRWLEQASTELNSSAIAVQNGPNGYIRTAHPHAGLTLSPNDGQYCIVNPRRSVVQRLSLQHHGRDGSGGNDDSGGVDGVSGGGGAAADAAATPEAVAGMGVPPPVMETVAGKVDESGNVDDCNGLSARFSSPTGIATLPDGSFVVVDQGNNTVRTVAAWPGDEVRTLVCTAAGPLGPDVAGERATFEKLGTTGVRSQSDHNPAIAADHNGNVAIVDGGCIRIISGIGVDGSAAAAAAETTITTIARERAVRGIVDGPAATARFLSVRSIAALPGGGWLLCDGNVVRKISADHSMVSTVAGSANLSKPSSTSFEQGFALPACCGVDGVGKSARFNCPQAVAVDTAGHALVADGTSQRGLKHQPQPCRHKPSFCTLCKRES